MYPPPSIPKFECPSTRGLCTRTPSRNSPGEPALVRTKQVHVTTSAGGQDSTRWPSQGRAGTLCHAKLIELPSEGPCRPSRVTSRERGGLRQVLPPLTGWVRLPEASLSEHFANPRTRSCSYYLRTTHCFSVHHEIGRSGRRVDMASTNADADDDTISWPTCPAKLGPKGGP